jgi:AraC-like DNA-binding protein
MPYEQNAALIRVSGSWPCLLTDWLDLHKVEAPAIRARVEGLQSTDDVPILVWAELLKDTFALRPAEVAPAAQIAQLVTLQHTGVLGYLAAACDTLGEALMQYQKFEKLFYGVSIGEFHSDGAEVTMKWQATPYMDHVEEVSVLALVSIVRKELVADITPNRVCFGHQVSTEHQQVLEDFFGCSVMMDSGCISLTFDLTALALPLQRGEPGLKRVLEEQAAALAKALPESDEFVRQLQNELVRLLPDGETGITDLAPRLHCSVRTLQRRLDDRGLTWKQLLERTREELACQYLAESNLNLLEISMLLGYGNQGTFSRAFKRWKNCSPLVYRKQLNQ